MVTFRNILLIIIFTFISSCKNFNKPVPHIDYDYSKTKIKIEHSSIVDTENIDLGVTDEIVIISFNDEDIISRNHVEEVVSEFKEKGFYNVYANKPTFRTKFIAYISLDKSIQTYTSDDYYHGQIIEIRRTSLYIRLIKIIDLTADGQYQTVRVMDLHGSTFNKMYHSDSLYSLLIKETISRVDLENNREEYSYIVDLKQKQDQKIESQ